GVFVWDWESWADLYLSCFRYLIRNRLRSPELARKPLVAATVAADHSAHASSVVPQTFSNPATGVNHRFAVGLPMAQIVAGLNTIQPESLMGYPSALHQLALEAREGRLKVAPRCLYCSGEPLFPETRSLLESTWKVPVINAWGASEAGGMGIQCGRGPGLHLSDDLVIIEPVDTAGRPVPPRVRSAKILVTNLYNPLLPLIRYEITDEITLLEERCPCGSAHRLVADVQGRLDDCFLYHGVGTVHPHIFRSRLGREANIIEYQVCQTDRGASILVRCRGPVDLVRVQRDLEGELRRQGLAHPEVSIAHVDRLERHVASGKLKRFVPQPRSTAES
ncbi:MAG: phenylacetate--CoA ligase family protein, partial [Acidobacteria bacterium]|nr:phenylacetate--CoA ligase family protein [Acidobacteriota bacterium]